MFASICSIFLSLVVSMYLLSLILAYRYSMILFSFLLHFHFFSTPCDIPLSNTLWDEWWFYYLLTSSFSALSNSTRKKKATGIVGLMYQDGWRECCYKYIHLWKTRRLVHSDGDCLFLQVLEIAEWFERRDGVLATIWRKTANHVMHTPSIFDLRNEQTRRSIWVSSLVKKGSCSKTSNPFLWWIQCLFVEFVHRHPFSFKNFISIRNRIPIGFRIGFEM